MFLFFPVVLVFAAFVLLSMVAHGQHSLDIRRSSYAEMEANGKAIDKAANIPDKASNSALAHAKLATMALEELASVIDVYKALANFLFAVAGGQFLLIAWMFRKSRPSSIPPKSDTHTL